MATATDKIIFYHIPKTGGTWVTNVLKHMYGNDAKKLGDKFVEDLGLFDVHVDPKTVTSDGRFSFAFVRDPVDWYRSRWARSVEQGWSNHNVIGRELKSGNFDEFVKNCMTKFPEGMLSETYRRFEDVDFIGRYENLREDLIKALTLADVEFDARVIREFGAVNVTDRETKSLARFGYGTKKKLKENEKYIYERFGYD